tara:strand:- start:124 stop:621 length:498 start_codon:yes stop_codon:yes gene_type:complete
MSTFDLVTFNSGDVLTAANLNTAFQNIKTLVDTTKLDPANLSKPNSIIAYPFYFPLVDSTTLKPMIKVPSTGITIIGFEFSIVSKSNTDIFGAMLKHGPTATGTFTEVLSVTQLLSAAGSVTYSGTFTPATVNSGFLQLDVSRLAGSGTASDVTVVVTVKSEHVV